MNGFLLDTNVISDLIKGKCANAGVAAWLSTIFDDALYLSAITIGEIEKGLVLAEQRSVDTTRQRRFLEHELPHRFQKRILAFDERCAQVWGRMLATLDNDRNSERVLAVDAQIAATAMTHQLTICTRKERDFRRLGMTRLLNPFKAD